MLHNRFHATVTYWGQKVEFMQKFHTLCEDIKIIFEKKLLIVEDDSSVGVRNMCEVWSTS